MPPPQTRHLPRARMAMRLAGSRRSTPKCKIPQRPGCTMCFDLPTHRKASLPSPRRDQRSGGSPPNPVPLRRRNVGSWRPTIFSAAVHRSRLPLILLSGSKWKTFPRFHNYMDLVAGRLSGESSFFAARLPSNAAKPAQGVRNPCRIVLANCT